MTLLDALGPELSANQRERGRDALGGGLDPDDVALRTDGLGEPDRVESDPAANVKSVRTGGKLQIVSAGHPVANPDELRVDTVVRSVIDSVKGHADVILIDAGPLLSAGDAISLASHVDAIVVITRLNALRTTILEELSRNLENLPATKLGFIVADAGKDERHGQYRGYFAQPSQAAGPARLTVARSPSVGNGTDERAARSTP